jgi:hypothetical protein
MRGLINGVLAPPGQTSWSKALVRHGADARVALAAVLGVGAEDIAVRESCGSDGAAKANTVPTTAPSNPSTPNTAAVGMKSKPASPSSPAGDN